MDAAPSGLREVRTICSHCATRCGVIVSVEGDRPVAIRGDPDHPLSEGFICPRGRAAIEYHDHPNRLNQPLRRSGARGEGRWSPVPWAEALDEIAERLSLIRDRHGPEALAYFFGTYHGTDQGIGLRFMNLFGSPNYAGNAFVCAGAKTTAEWVTVGFSPAAPDLTPGAARCVVVWGQHPSASNPPLWGRIRRAQRAGARLIVIDPVRTAEARAADLWLPVRPGSDGALALGLIHLILQEGRADDDFIRDWTTGADALAELSAAFPPARVAALTGLDEADIRAAAAIYTDGPAAISNGVVNGMGLNTFATERAKLCLMAITGNLNRAGGNRLAGPTARVMTKSDTELYDRLPASQRALRLGGQDFPLHVGGYDRICAAARRVWPQHPHAATATRSAVAHPPSIFRAILQGDPYPVKAALVQHNGIIGNYANAALGRQALMSPNLDLLVVHELHMTPTAALADFVLPAAGWLEKSHMYVNGESGSFFAGARPVPPVAGRISDYDLCRELGLRLGQGAHWPATLDHLWDEMLAPAALRFEELTARERTFVADPSGYDHAAPDAGGEPVGFATPSRRIELSSSIMAELGLDPLPRWLDDTALRPGPRYPLRLMTGATDINLTHTDSRHIPALRARRPDPLARLSPDLAASHGIEDGDWIEIENDLGQIRHVAKIDAAMPPDTVSAERWWFPEREAPGESLFGMLDHGVNTLGRDDTALSDRSFGTWPLRMERCRIRKLPA